MTLDMRRNESGDLVINVNLPWHERLILLLFGKARKTLTLKLEGL